MPNPFCGVVCKFVSFFRSRISFFTAYFVGLKGTEMSDCEKAWKVSEKEFRAWLDKEKLHYIWIDQSPNCQARSFGANKIKSLTCFYGLTLLRGPRLQLM